LVKHLFYYTTTLGNGLIFFIVGIIFLFFSYRKGLIFLFTFVLHIIPVQLIKQVILPNVKRPTRHFYELFVSNKLHLVDGVDVHGFHSFPSGHTASAFAMFFLLIFFVKNKIAKILLLFLAFAVGYSRIYLSQHFFIDVYFGSIIGASCTFLILYFFYIKENYIFSTKKKFDNGILKKLYEN
jgi:membrane-associated phospholipid phosphatase